MYDRAYEIRNQVCILKHLNHYIYHLQLREALISCFIANHLIINEVCWQVTNFMVTFDPKIKWRPLLCMCTMLMLYDKSLRNASLTSKHFMVEQHVSITKNET